MKRTDWYSGDQHPVRDGWYERDYSSVCEDFGSGWPPVIFRDLWQQKYPGVGFWYVMEPYGEIIDAWEPHLPWRGLIKEG